MMRTQVAIAVKQEQFLNVIDRDEAERRFRSVLDLTPLESESAALAVALGRVLACDVVAPVDVPSFDRSNVDGFAVRAEDTFGASEERPRTLYLSGEVLSPGIPLPTHTDRAHEATSIATGAMLPRGADAVVMVEHTDMDGPTLVVRRPVAPGANVSYAGTDIGRGETVLWRGDLLTARETGVLAALGLAQVDVVRKPRVAVISTGNELIPPGATMQPGLVYDSNATILADTIRELGGEPVAFGVVADDHAALKRAVQAALTCDVVVLSGGTSKGEGDLSYRVVAELGPPGIVAHGVALKPGKPLCLAAVRRSSRTIPVVILPGFPTSAIFTFHEFVAPVIRAMAGRPAAPARIVEARLPMRVNSERGRTEYLLVGLVPQSSSPGAHAPGPPDLTAFPMGKGSGSVTTFSRADGYVIIPRQQEYLDAGATVHVHLLSDGIEPPDLVVIGSHCVGLDLLLGRLRERGYRSRFLAVGSTGGLDAVRRGECDLAGIHLLDAASQTYNAPFLTADMTLVRGYRRMQGFVYRANDARFVDRTREEALAAALADADCAIVNRNRGSGTRILIDQLLGAARPPGYTVEARSHNSVAAAVVQGRADWGVAIETVAHLAGLAFLPLCEEHFDFAVPTTRRDRPAVRAFCQLLQDAAVCAELRSRGLSCAAQPTEQA
jgi:putative molybdopterin biosynthesis protein